jgi:hypothetical protein
VPLARREYTEAAIKTGGLRRVADVDLLDPARLPALARDSLGLFLVSGTGFLLLNVLAHQVNHAGPLLGTGPLPVRVVALIVVNLVVYAAMIGVHELVHAGVILGLGGRPSFGLRLPFAAYCTAPGQLFTVPGYTAVALAPLVVLTLVGIVVTWVAPDIGALLWLALAGNVSGAVGDLTAVRSLRQLQPGSLIADTATGFTAYAPGGVE